MRVLATSRATEEMAISLSVCFVRLQSVYAITQNHQHISIFCLNADSCSVIKRDGRVFLR